MAKSPQKPKGTNNKPKEPRTIKVSTVVIAVLVLVGLVASFIGGVQYANNYNSVVEAKAMEQVKTIELKLNQ